MKFYVYRRKRAPTIIIVALIDILIVLLIFLLVTTTFKQQPAIKLTLPESAYGVKEQDTQTQPLIVYVDKEGKIRIGNDPTPIPMERIERDIQVTLAYRKTSQVAIAADQQAPFGVVIKIVDTAKKLGVTSVQAYIRPPQDQKH